MNGIVLSQLRRAYNQGYEAAVNAGLAMPVEAHESGLRAVEDALREQIAREISDKTPDGRKAQAFCAGMDTAARIARGEA